MICYKLTYNQKELITGNEYAINCYFNPVQDIAGNWCIFEGEVVGCVNPEFEFIKTLESMEFEPHKINEDEIW